MALAKSVYSPMVSGSRIDGRTVVGFENMILYSVLYWLYMGRFMKYEKRSLKLHGGLPGGSLPEPKGVRREPRVLQRAQLVLELVNLCC